MDGAEELVAAAHLADEVRSLIERVVSIDVDKGSLLRAASLVASASAALDGEARPYDEPARLDQAMPPGLRAHGLLVGPGHPMAPPVRLSWDGDRVVGRLRLRRSFEGPRGYAHGGVSALLLDEVTAKIRSLMAVGRVTRRLAVSYRRPVPVDVDLVVAADLVSQDERRAVAAGTIALAQDPDVALVTAETHFVLLGGPDDSTALGRLTL
ncbi:hotdog domain-containing protein [Nocardioides pantholopis]|uniref:hotdog domain-containing protein n=1 Tax=Nocardioides pantholopis TaxID=2483798 RepID=UPI000FD87F86|nr:hotdog domain-containing protein [Nocardioides pantholopis]